MYVIVQPYFVIYGGNLPQLLELDVQMLTDDCLLTPRNNQFIHCTAMDTDRHI